MTLAITVCSEVACDIFPPNVCWTNHADGPWVAVVSCVAAEILAQWGHCPPTGQGACVCRRGREAGQGDRMTRTCFQLLGERPSSSA